MNKTDSDIDSAAFSRIEAQTRKGYVFTVTDMDKPDKPTVWCQTADSSAVYDQAAAETLISGYVEKHFGRHEADEVLDGLEDIAYMMRKKGAAWYDERWCFELTEVTA